MHATRTWLHLGYYWKRFGKEKHGEHGECEEERERERERVY